MPKRVSFRRDAAGKEGLVMLGALRAVAAIISISMAASVGGGAAAQQRLDRDQLVGRWQGYEAFGGYRVQSEVLFFPDGTYQRWSALGSLMAMHRGAWEVMQNWVHFSPTDYEPKIYQGRPMAPPPSETWIVDAFDGTNIHATVGGMSEVSFRRVP